MSSNLTVADEKFLELVWHLLDNFQKKLTPTLIEKNDSSIKVKINLPGTTTSFDISVITTVTQKSEPVDDPRLFGDAEHVVKQEMADWFPGKTNHWTETTRTISIQASNLPSDSVRNYDLQFTYNTFNCYSADNVGYESEKIYQLILSMLKETQKKEKEDQEKKMVKDLTEAFNKLSKN